MSANSKSYVRFPLARRVEHIVLLSTFIILAATGLPQKYPNSPISVFIAQALGGIENLYAIHHFTTPIVMLAVIYHMLTIGYQVFVLRSKWSMMLAPQDLKDGLQALLYNIGLAKAPPKMGRYTFEEKFEYWAFVWGYTVMGITGFIMWNPIIATTYLPGEFVPAAKAAHGGEAVLAVLAILIWHMYHVRIKRINNAMFNGLQSEADMVHEHPLEFADIEAGIADRRPDPATLRKRQMIYYPIAAILTLAMLAGIYGFINAEKTAETTLIPLTEKQIFVPQTPQP